MLTTISCNMTYYDFWTDITLSNSTFICNNLCMAHENNNSSLLNTGYKWDADAGLWRESSVKSWTLLTGLWRYIRPCKGLWSVHIQLTLYFTINVIKFQSVSAHWHSQTLCLHAHLYPVYESMSIPGTVFTWFPTV